MKTTAYIELTDNFVEIYLLRTFLVLPFYSKDRIYIEIFFA